MAYSRHKPRTQAQIDEAALFKKLATQLNKDIAENKPEAKALVERAERVPGLGRFKGNNPALIQTQCDKMGITPTDIRTMLDWNLAGRQIIAGNKPIWVTKPVEGGDGETNFRRIPQYDISQTKENPEAVEWGQKKLARWRAAHPGETEAVEVEA